jgi:hypothetical protein
MFRRFGSEVTLVEMKVSVMHHEDAAASALVAELLHQEGVRLRLNAECISFSKDPDGVSVQTGCMEGDTDIHGSHVLPAMGRTPNTDDLGLDAAGVKTDSSGYIPVDDQLRTNVAHIWALGDCNRRGGFTHTAYNDFEIVAANLLEGGNRRVTDRISSTGDLYRSTAGAGRDDGRRGTGNRKRASDRDASHGLGITGDREGRDFRFDESNRRCANKTNSGRKDLRSGRG